jgi:hypothetical protein
MKAILGTIFVGISIVFCDIFDMGFSVWFASSVGFSLGLLLIWVTIDDRKEGEPYDQSNLSVFIFILILVIVFVSVFMLDSPISALVASIGELLGNAVGYKYRKK